MLRFGNQKRRKLDQFLYEYRKDSEIAISEMNNLSNRIWKLLIAFIVTTILLILLLPSPSHIDQLDWQQGLCLALLAFLVNGLGWSALLQIQPRLFDRPASFNQFIVLLLLSVMVSKGVFLMGWSPFLAPVPVLAMILTMIYGQSVALLVTLGVGLYIALMSPNALHDYSELVRIHIVLALALSLGGMTVVIGFKRVRQQSRPAIVGGIAGIVQALTVVAFQVVDPNLKFRTSDLQSWDRLRELLENPTWAFLGALISGALVTVLLPAIESLFGIVTERRLLALGDTNNEVLKTLRNRAPGTYQHTLGVAQLSSAAAESLEAADPLLCQVGAYYHDIGKIMRPEYFVENMSEDNSIHSRLRPSMSKLIIISHVKEGVELALESKLPPILIDMIPMHHGTTVVEYFFYKALEQGNGDSKESETEYRYPGPKPSFPEAGILMLSDAVEAIAKTIAEPNPDRFRDMVRGIIHKRLLDGQLDDCSLTMRDLRRIEDSFVRTLTNMYHGRTRYPWQNGQSDGVVGESAANGAGDEKKDDGTKADSQKNDSRKKVGSSQSN